MFLRESPSFPERMESFLLYHLDLKPKFSTFGDIRKTSLTSFRGQNKLVMHTRFTGHIDEICLHDHCLSVHSSHTVRWRLWCPLPQLPIFWCGAGVSNTKASRRLGLLFVVVYGLSFLHVQVSACRLPLTLDIKKNLQKWATNAGSMASPNKAMAAADRVISLCACLQSWCRHPPCFEPFFFKKGGY